MQLSREQTSWDWGAQHPRRNLLETKMEPTDHQIGLVLQREITLRDVGEMAQVQRIQSKRKYKATINFRINKKVVKERKYNHSLLLDSAVKNICMALIM